ncbi:MAG: hypothetical protein EAX90_11910 [Candidatus Heimdallarchaeota archaeon]|nr:hypothetical protein [Candidatus Heimdallarchaeota archaeon]
MKKEGKLVPKYKRHEIFFYYICCYTSECPDKYETDDSLPSIPRAEISKKSPPRSIKGISTLKEETLEKEEIINIAETKKRISELVTDENKIRIQLISTITLIPLDIVIKILTEDSTNRIIGDFVTKRKIIKGICSECNNYYETISDFYPSCRVEIKI